MARAKTAKVETTSPLADDNVLADALDTPSLPFETESAEDVMGKEVVVPVDERYGPPMWHESWPDWAIRQFHPETEFDPKGLPLVAGLRRLTRKLLGPILFSGPLSPSEVKYANIDADRYTMLAPTTCYYGLRILWTRPEDGVPFEVEFREVADVLVGNMDRKFLRFPSASASTRAESRCLRKALQLKVISSDEATDIPDNETDVDGYIRLSNINFMEAICARPNVNIDLYKFINSGEFAYESILNIPAKKADTMMELLCKWQNDPSLIPEKLKGFKKNWKETCRYND